MNKWLNQVHFGNCLETLRKMPAGLVDACVTSPPYFAMRDYRCKGQIGLETSPEEFVSKLVEVFSQVQRVLKKDGTLWIVMGDTYAQSGGAGKRQGGLSQRKNRSNLAEQSKVHTMRPPSGMKVKDLMGIPWRLAFALQGFAVIPSATVAQWIGWLGQAIQAQDWELVEMVHERMKAQLWLHALQEKGWYLRNDIIWNKSNAAPESVDDRCTRSHEYMFMLSRSKRYYFDANAIKEPVSRSDWQTESSGEQSAMRQKRTVWSVNTEPYRGAHFAAYPTKLIEPCIMASTRPGEVVLDPFMGSGTTGEVAQNLGRQWVGCEINPAYAPLQKSRHKQLGLMLEMEE